MAARRASGLQTPKKGFLSVCPVVQCALGFNKRMKKTQQTHPKWHGRVLAAHAAPRRHAAWRKGTFY